MTKKEIEVHFDSSGVLIINGQSYVPSIERIKDVDGIKHVDKTLVRKFDIKAFESKANYIAMRIMDSLDKKQLIKELLEKKGISEVEKLYSVLKGDEKLNKKKITKQNGCVGIKVGTGKQKTGGYYLQLIE